MDDAPFADQDRALDAVFQFPDIARPVVAHQHVDRRGGDPSDAPRVGSGIFLDEMVGQEKDVRPALPERRNKKAEDVQPVVKVFPERAFRQRLFEVDVRGGDQPDVDPHRFDPAEALEFPLLENAEELDLRRGGEVAHFVEEQGAAVRQLESPLLLLVGSGEGSWFVPEQLRFDEALRQRGAVDLDERLARSRRVVVDRVGNQLFAGPRFPPDQNGGVRGRRLGDLLVELLHRVTRPDQVVNVVPFAKFFLELAVFLHQPVALRLQKAMHARRLPQHRRGDSQNFHEVAHVPVLLVDEGDP